MDRLLTWKRVHRYPLMGLTVGLVAGALNIGLGHLPLDIGGNPVAVDLSAHLTAGRLVVYGDPKRLYDFAYQYEIQQRLIEGLKPDFFDLFLSPPFVAYLYAPFALLPYLLSAVIWTVLTIALLFASFRMIWPLVPGVHQFGYWFVLAVVFSAWPFMELIFGGQDSAISLFLLAAGLRLLLARHDGTAGLVLGLGLFKPQLFFLIPILFLCQKRWRALTTFCAVGLVCAAFSLVVMGPATVWSYLNLFLSGTYEATIVADEGWLMESAVALARALFTGFLGFLVTPAIILIFVAAVVLFVQAARKPTPTDRTFQLLYALAIIAGAIANPHFFLYDCVVLALPVLIIFDDASVRPIIRVSITAVYLLTWVVPLVHKVVGQASWPATLLGAPWVVVPMVVLAVILRKRLLGDGDENLGGVRPESAPG